MQQVFSIVQDFRNCRNEKERKDLIGSYMKKLFQVQIIRLESLVMETFLTLSKLYQGMGNSNTDRELRAVSYAIRVLWKLIALFVMYAFLPDALQMLVGPVLFGVVYYFLPIGWHFAFHILQPRISHHIGVLSVLNYARSILLLIALRNSIYVCENQQLASVLIWSVSLAVLFELTLTVDARAYSFHPTLWKHKTNNTDVDADDDDDELEPNDNANNSSKISVSKIAHKFRYRLILLRGIGLAVLFAHSTAGWQSCAQFSIGLLWAGNVAICLMLCGFMDYSNRQHFGFSQSWMFDLFVRFFGSWSIFRIMKHLMPLSNFNESEYALLLSASLWFPAVMSILITEFSDNEASDQSNNTNMNSSPPQKTVYKWRRKHATQNKNREERKETTLASQDLLPRASFAKTELSGAKPFLLYFDKSPITKSHMLQNALILFVLAYNIYLQRSLFQFCAFSLLAVVASSFFA